MAKSSSSDVNKNKTMGVLAYFLFFLPLVAAKDSKFAMFHANQSLILLILSVASAFVGGMIPVLGALIQMVVSLGVFVLWIMGIVSAANGETKPLPVIGGFTLLK